MIFPVLGESYNLDPMEEIPARYGSDVDLYCRLSGNGPMYWERPDGRPLTRAQQYDGLLRVQNVISDDGGVYLCRRGDQKQYIRLKVENGNYQILLTFT